MTSKLKHLREEELAGLGPVVSATTMHSSVDDGMESLWHGYMHRHLTFITHLNS